MSEYDIYRNDNRLIVNTVIPFTDPPLLPVSIHSLVTHVQFVDFLVFFSVTHSSQIPKI